MDKETAIELANSEWWKAYSPKEVALAQLKEPILCMPFDIFHQMVEKAIGRPVWTHEFINPMVLIAEINGNINQPTFEEILYKLPNKNRIVVFGD